MTAKVTLKTIAERTGLSVPTVSQILNGRDGNYSSAATRNKVLKAAQELHYRPNFGYRLLRGQRTDTAAIMFSALQFYNESKQRRLLLALLENFNRDGWSTYIHSFTMDETVNTELVRSLLNRGVESFVILGSPLGYPEITAVLEQSGAAFIGSNPVFPRYVSNGSELGRRRILRRIAEETDCGFKVLCHGGELTSDTPDVRRLLEFFPGLTAAEAEERFLVRLPAPRPRTGGDWLLELAAYQREARERGAAAMAGLLRLPRIPRAVICPNDAFAIGCGGCLLSPGNEKFRDRILLAGYNNDPTLNDFPLPIISGEDDIRGQARLLVERCRDHEPCRITMPPRLHFRRRKEGSAFPGWEDEVEELAVERK